MHMETGLAARVGDRAVHGVGAAHLYMLFWWVSALCLAQHRCEQ